MYAGALGYKVTRAIREVYYLDWPFGRQEIHYGVRLMHPKPSYDALLRRVVKGFLPPIYGKASERWIIEQIPKHSATKGTLYSDTFWAMTKLPIALLLTMGPKIAFGPVLYIRPESHKMPFIGISYDFLWTFGNPVDKWRRWAFDDPFTLDDLRMNFSHLISHQGSQFLDRMLHRFCRACINHDDESAIIDLATALEQLYVCDERAKRRHIAERGATFIGQTSADQEEIYNQLSAFYMLRNSIVHEGKLPSTMTFPSGERQRYKKVFIDCLVHVAKAVRVLISQPSYATISKQEFIGELDKLVSTVRTELSSYEASWLVRPVPTNAS